MKRLFLLFLLLSLHGCSAKVSSPSFAWDGMRGGEKRHELVAYAQAKLRSSGSFRVGRQRFPRDCSGFVVSAHYAQGIDIYGGARILNQRGNGVLLLKNHVERYGLMFAKKAPLPGDLVFFSNTYDRNRDGRLNDPWSHVGIVEKVQADGTVVYIHRGSRRVQRSFMNLEEAGSHQTRSGKELNSYLRRRTRRDPPGTRYLSAQVFEAFGTLIRPFPDP